MLVKPGKISCILKKFPEIMEDYIQPKEAWSTLATVLINTADYF